MSFASAIQKRISRRNNSLETSHKNDENTARIIASEEGYVLYVNESFANLAGIKPGKLEGMHLLDIISFKDMDSAFRQTGPMIAANQVLSELIPGAHDVLPGEKEESFSLQFDWIKGQDKKSYLIGSATKISGRDKIRQLIAEKIREKKSSREKINIQSPESELRHFLNMSHDLMAICSIDGTFIRTNDTFNVLLGYDGAKLQSMNFLDIVHPEDKAPVKASMQSLVHEEENDRELMIDFEIRVIDVSGRAYWMDWQHKRIGDLVYSVGRDITAIKEHEEELQRRELQLSEAEAIGHMGHWRWKIGSDNISFSDEIYSIFGVDQESFAPTLDNVNAMLHKRDVGRMMQAFQRAIIEENDYDMDFRVIRPDGHLRYVRCEGRCEKDADDEVIALFGIMQDITEATLHEQNLREAKEAAERAYSAKTQFLANMSHELRTPLNAIIGFSEMMQRQLLGPIGTERYLEYIKGIRESGEHLLDLISDILDMSKIEAGKYQLDLEELNIAKIIRLAVHMMEGRAVDSGIKINIDIENEEKQAIIDRRAFMQILLNLLSNAVKFSHPQGAVNIECKLRDDYFTVTITDKGIGIPANKLRNITRPFEQVASHYTRKHEGSGLGLAITKELIDLHGGQMHIDSVVDEGTTVSVRLPYDASQTRKDKNRRQSEQPDSIQTKEAVNG